MRWRGTSKWAFPQKSLERALLTERHKALPAAQKCRAYGAGGAPWLGPGLCRCKAWEEGGCKGHAPSS